MASVPGFLPGFSSESAGFLHSAAQHQGNFRRCLQWSIRCELRQLLRVETVCGGAFECQALELLYKRVHHQLGAGTVIGLGEGGQATDALPLVADCPPPVHRSLVGTDA